MLNEGKQKKSNDNAVNKKKNNEMAQHRKWKGACNAVDTYRNPASSYDRRHNVQLITIEYGAYAVRV